MMKMTVSKSPYRIMAKIHNIRSVGADNDYLYLVIEHKYYGIQWKDCSPRLAKASMSQRKRFDIAPSGYGIHWPEIDEDLAIRPLLQHAEIRKMETEDIVIDSVPS